MKFTEALREMKEGKKVKLPSWGGYWYWDKEKQTVMIQCRPQDSDQGELLDIRETQSVEYTLSNVASDEWIIADEMNCPFLISEKHRELNILFRMWHLMNGLLQMKRIALFWVEKQHLVLEMQSSTLNEG